MAEPDIGFKIAARVSGRQLAALAGVRGDSWQPLGGEVQTTERLADRAFRTRVGGERCIVYMEAYTRWKSEAPWSVLAKSGLLSERERLPTLSLVYILRPRSYQPQQGTFRLQVDKQTTQQVWFREVALWQLTPEPSWETAPGLMALYPLCRHGQRPAAAVRYAAGAINANVTDSIVRSDLLTSLYIFGKLVYPQVDLLGLIGREQMRESKAYEEIMHEGELKANRENVVQALQVRFGEAAAQEFAAALNEQDDLQELKRLHELAIRCRRLPDFRRGLTTPASRP